MTHAHNSSPQSATTRMVMQYGHRDEDDDDDSAYDSDEERHKSLFGGMMMMHNRRGSQERKGMGGLGGALQNLGASMTFGHASGEDDDSDDESVGSITAKAKQVFKNFGDSISSGIKLAKKKKKKRRNSNDDDEEESDSDDSDEEESGSEEEEEDDDDSDSESDMDDDRSVASRTAKAVRKVTGKIGQALSLGRRSDDESDEDEDDDSDEEEEDPLQTHNNNNKRSGSRGILPRLTSSFGSGSGVGNPRAKDVLLMQQDGSHGSQGSNSGRNGRRRRSNERTPLRRSHTADETHPPHHGPAGAGFHRCQTTESRNQYAKAAAKVLAQEAYVEPAQAVWSMNVTEQMLEQATNEGIYVPPAANQPQQPQQRQQKSKLRA